jgi:chemosensory pili system protein ChpA (sensor histidine kinase/response regulator)
LSTPGQEFVEVFLQEASEHLQFLREYCGILQDPYPVPEAVERLYISAHTLSGTSASYGFPLFSEVAGKLSHIFQYAMNAVVAPEAAPALVEFISEAIAVLESDVLMISDRGSENADEVVAFRQRYPFAFSQSAAPAEAAPKEASAPIHLQTPDEPRAGTEDVLEPERSAQSQPESTEPEAQVPDLEPDDDVPAEILEFFVPEAEEQLQIAQSCLLSLETKSTPDDINHLFRALHTVKGAAAQVGLHRISRIAHAAEDLIGKIREGEIRPSSKVVDLCLEGIDCIRKFLHREWPDEVTLQNSTKSLLARIAGYLPPEQAAPPPAAEEAKVQAGTAQLPATAHEQHAPAVHKFDSDSIEPDIAEPEVIAGLRSKEPAALPQSKSVRIALERLDRMMNAVGELVINRTRMLGRLAELEHLTDVLNFSKARMSDKVGGFQAKYEFTRIPAAGMKNAPIEPGNIHRSAFRQFDGINGELDDFSELEMDRYDDFNILSRSLTEISADISEVLTQLDGFVRRVDSDIDEFTKLAHRLQDDITQARMVPIGNLYARITRTVRDAAKATGKQVELALSGAETELDNNIIQQISDPLIHLVRNAVAHGLESAEDRYESGKSDHGNVAVRAYHRGNHIFIEVEDDGYGIDYEKVRSKAVELGLASAEDAAQLSERDLLEILFHPGFSTAQRKTELAGRGVGLDVVRSNVSALNGEIDIETQKRGGTRFTLKVPLTLIISQALFVRCGEHMFALPLAFVEEIRRLRADDIEDVGGKLLTKVRETVTEIVRLDSQLGLKPADPINGYYRLVIANVAGRQVGIIVEDVLRKDEIVIKNLGPYLRNVKMFPGATIAPDGNLILLIDVNRLIAGEAIERRPLMTPAGAARIFAPGAEAVATGSIPRAAMEIVPEEKVVVLADDSISIRKFVGRMLEKAGYRVKLACDGLEALEIALQVRCDLIITDLEMPRTNGYELMSHLRQADETRNIPVMVVTSRAGAKHRERAMREGARAFLTKPVQEEQFIAAVWDLIGPAKPVEGESIVVPA